MYTTQKLTKEQKAAINAVVKKYIPDWVGRNTLNILPCLTGGIPALFAAGAFALDLTVLGGLGSAIAITTGALPLTLKRGTIKIASGQKIESSFIIYATLDVMEKKLSKSFQAVAAAQPADRAKLQAEFEALRAEITADRDVLSPVYRVFENPEGIDTDKCVFCLEEPGEHTIEGTNVTVMSDGVYDTLEPDQPVPVQSKPKRALKLGK